MVAAGACWMLAAAFAHAQQPAAQAQPAVAVTVESGRTFVGNIDERTDAKQLWLRMARGSMSILRPIDWQVVRVAEIDGQQLTAEQLRDQVEGLKSAGERLPRGNGPAVEPAAEEFTPPPVVSLQIEATIANWDADVETDGIVITVLPIDAWGQVTPCDGTLELELIAEGPGTTGLLRTFPTIARWTRTLRRDEIGQSGYIFRLRYDAVHPEFQLHLGPYGLLHAVLAVPGYGAFEASASATSLRPYNPMRDRWQQFNRQRFFPNERTGEGKQQMGLVNGA